MQKSQNLNDNSNTSSQKSNENSELEIIKNLKTSIKTMKKKLQNNDNKTTVLPTSNTILVPCVQQSSTLPLIKFDENANIQIYYNHKRNRWINLLSLLIAFASPLIITGLAIATLSIKKIDENKKISFNNETKDYMINKELGNLYSIYDINDENINLVMSGLINGESIIPQGFSASYLIIEKNKSKNYIKVLVNLINKNDEIYNKTCIIKGFNTKEYNITRNSIDISSAKNTLLSQIKIKSENDNLFLDTKLYNSKLLGAEFNKYSNLDEIKNDLDLDIIGMTKDFGVRISIEKQEVTDFSENSLINILNIKLKLEKGNDIDYLDFFVKGFKSLVDIKQEFDDFVKDYSSNGFISHSNVAFNNKLVFDFNFKNNEQHKTLLDNIIKEYVSNYININPNFIDKIEYNNISYNPYGPRIIDGREKSIFLSSKITYSPFKNSNKSLKLNINFELCGFNTLEEEVFYFIDSIEPNLFAMGDDKNLYPFEVNYSEYHRFDEHIGNFNKIKIMENELNEKYQNVASGDKLIFSFTPYNHLYEKMEHDVNMAGKKKLRFSVTLNNTINILKFYKIISGFKDKTLPEKPILQERPILDTKK